MPMTRMSSKCTATVLGKQSLSLAGTYLEETTLQMEGGYVGKSPGELKCLRTSESLPRELCTDTDP